MHYPLAMLLLALMDQRACKELEEPGPLQQNGHRGRGQRAGRWRWREEGRGREGGGRRGLWGSWLSECHQLDPPKRRPQRAGFYRVKENLGATVWTTEKNNKTEVKRMIVLALLVKLKSY